MRDIRLLQSHILTSTICLTCLDMVSGSSLGVTPEPHSATTGGLTGATGCGQTDAAMRHEDCQTSKNAHTHHIIHFPNVQRFDVANFDVFKHCVSAFVLKNTLHPQKVHKCPPAYKKRLK